jgi:hypothetical protein
MQDRDERSDFSILHNRLWATSGFFHPMQAHTHQLTQNDASMKP